MAATPLVYFVLGTPGSGRRGVILDLLENGREPGERSAVLVAEAEPPSPRDAALAALPRVVVRRWAWPGTDFPDFRLPACDTLFLVADSLADTVDQIEALKRWLAARGLQLARVLLVVDCQLASTQPGLRPWFDACAHFSDVVLLTKREGVPNKWLSDFRRHFEAECYPCHFIPLRKGGIENPALVLEPAPRRVSQYFEPEETIQIEGLVTDDEEPEEDEKLPEDPYIARRRGGRRARELPAPRDFLPARSA
jgi:hypothetical protein